MIKTHSPRFAPHRPTRRLRAASLLLSLALLLLAALPVAAQEPGAAGAGAAAGTGAPSAPPSLDLGGAQIADDGTVSVLVELGAPPAADAWLATAQTFGVDASGVPMDETAIEPASGASVDALAAMAAASQAQLATVTAQQQALTAPLATLGAVELYRAQRLYNAVAVRVPAANLAALRALPGVVNVRGLLPKTIDMKRSVPFLGIPYVWQGVYGGKLTGENVRVGVIDTGVDYLHVTFAGPGGGYYALNDTTVIGDVPGFPGNKVLGGWDFVGDAYNADPAAPPANRVPKPDPDPMDCYGHGTHVAGTVAGQGVTAALQTFAGPFGAATPFEQLRVGPGVAPGASLYALKVFGCSGTSEIVDAAIEWAVDPNSDGNFSDHLDIINMSLGSGFGSPLDSTSVASNKASALGTFVVSSAGNNSSLNFVTGSPGTATRVLSVAATQLSTGVSEWLEGSTADQLAGFSSLGPRRIDALLKPEIAAPGVAISSALAGSGYEELTLSGTSMASPHVAGAAAILLQQRPTLKPEELKALLMNTAAPVVRMLEASYQAALAPLQQGGTGRLDVPSALRSDVFAYNAGAPGLVSLSFGAPEVLGSFSAERPLRVVNRGAQPRTYDLFYTPQNADSDLAGVDVQVGQSALTLAPASSAIVPVRVAIDAAAMRNGSVEPSGSLLASDAVLEAEGGLVWLWPRPSTFSASATGAKSTPPNLFPGTAALTANFSLATRTLEWTVAVGNTTETVREVTLRRGPTASADPAPAYTLFERGSGPAPALPLHGTTQISAADLPLLAGEYLQVAVEFAPSGYTVMATLTSGVPILKVPLYLAPRPASAMRAAQSTIDFGTGESLFRPVPLTGQTLFTSGAPTATVALLAPFELHARSPRAPATQEPPTPAWADIQYVGITSDLHTAGSVENTTVSFAVATYDRWQTPEQFSISLYVDSTLDNVPDYIVEHGASGWVGADGHLTQVVDLATGSRDYYGPINGAQRSQFVIPALNTNTMVLNVPATALGLSATQSRFTVIARTVLYVQDELSVGDQAPKATYDILRPAIAFDGPFVLPSLLPDVPGNSLVARLNVVYAASSTADGILLIHHHNTAAARAEVVETEYAWPYNLTFPFAGQ